MAINFPGPYEVRIYYTVSFPTLGAVVHVQRLNCDLETPGSPGDTFGDLDVILRNGSTIALNTQLTNWINLIKPFFRDAETTFDYAELWKYEPLSFEADFISTQTIGVTGSITTGSQVAASQCIWSFRTLEGGTMKISLMESLLAPGARLGYGLQSSLSQALVDYILGPSNGWLARDTSFPFSHIAQFPGQNEAVFKKRYRP